LVERQGQVEDLAGLDLAVADQVDELGQEAAYRGGPAAHADVGVQQLLAGQLDTVGHADDADEAAGSGRAQGLGHRLAGADALQHGVGADPVRPIAATMQDRLSQRPPPRPRMSRGHAAARPVFMAAAWQPPGSRAS